MSQIKTYERQLHAALGDAIAAPETPEFMPPEKEALALMTQCQRVDGELRSGYCPVVRLMALAQQAMRCAAVAIEQSELRDAAVSRLLSLVPGGLE